MGSLVIGAWVPSVLIVTLSATKIIIYNTSNIKKIETYYLD